VEIAKMQMAESKARAYSTAQNLVEVLDTSLRLLHPFIPFVTEEIWSHLKSTCEQHGANFTPSSGWKDALMVADWPTSQPAGKDDEKVIAQFTLVMDIVRAIRNYRAENNITPGKKLEAQFYCGDKISIIQSQLGSICFLAHLDRSLILVREKRPKEVESAGAIVISGVEILLHLEEGIDTAAESDRLEKELREISEQIERLQTLLQSSFASKAPPMIVEKERQKLVTFQQTAAKLRDQLDKLKL
jgi:valyl-tRNA synthetase